MNTIFTAGCMAFEFAQEGLLAPARTRTTSLPA